MLAAEQSQLSLSVTDTFTDQPILVSPLRRSDMVGLFFGHHVHTNQAVITDLGGSAALEHSHGRH